MLSDEGAALQWLTDNGVSRETVDTLKVFASLLIAENRNQNLIAAADEGVVFARHIVDSAQLIALANCNEGHWVDLGSGAGLPGIVTALISSAPTTLIESRRLRAAWLSRVVCELGIHNATVLAVAVERAVLPPATVITARAFAPLSRLLAVAAHLSDRNTLWLLPKGRRAPEELASIESTWHGDFRLVGSVTDPDSAIIVARDVRPKPRTRARGRVR